VVYSVCLWTVPLGIKTGSPTSPQKQDADAHAPTFCFSNPYAFVPTACTFAPTLCVIHKNKTPTRRTSALLGFSLGMIRFYFRIATARRSLLVFLSFLALKTNRRTCPKIPKMPKFSNLFRTSSPTVPTLGRASRLHHVLNNPLKTPKSNAHLITRLFRRIKTPTKSRIIPQSGLNRDYSESNRFDFRFPRRRRTCPQMTGFDRMTADDHQMLGFANA